MIPPGCCRSGDFGDDGGAVDGGATDGNSTGDDAAGATWDPSLPQITGDHIREQSTTKFRKRYVGDNN